MAEVTCIVDTNAGASPDYTSLAAAIAGEAGGSPVVVTSADLVSNSEQLTIVCRASGSHTADTASNTIDIDGFTVNSSYYVKIWTDPSESYRHPGWPNAGSETHYRIVSSKSYGDAILIDMNYTEFIGIDAKRTGDGSSSNYVVIALSYANILVDTCMVKDTYGSGISVDTGSGNRILNSIAYKCGDAGMVNTYGSCTWVNNTSVNNDEEGFYAVSSSYICRWINNLSYGNTGVDYSFAGWNGSSICVYCASEDDTADDQGGAGNKTGISLTFEDSANDDYHLDSGDTDVIDDGIGPTDGTYGSDIPTLDVDGDTRSGATCDIGFDEYVAGGTTVSPTTLAPTTLPPTTSPPTTLAPTTLSPTTSPPTTLAPTTSPPTTVAPTTLAPTTEPPTTTPPTTSPPTTLAPTTLAPTTLAPTTLAPTTIAPTTTPPTTLAPTTSPPTTLAPTTAPPTTLAPTTSPPTTLAPTTSPPTTLAPTTAPPTTVAPTTVAPTTLPPTTLAPTTSPPTTLPPTTLAPTTLVPTTLGPTTAPPTTLPPTTAPPTTAAPADVALAVFETDANATPVTSTHYAGKSLASGEWIIVPMTVDVKPGHYYRLREIWPTAEIVSWVEYTF